MTAQNSQIYKRVKVENFDTQLDVWLSVEKAITLKQRVKI